MAVQVEVAPSQMAASSQHAASSGASDGAAASQKALPEGKAGSQQAPVDVSLTPPGTPPSSGAGRSPHLGSTLIVAWCVAIALIILIVTLWSCRQRRRSSRRAR